MRDAPQLSSFFLSASSKPRTRKSPFGVVPHQWPLPFHFHWRIIDVRLDLHPLSCPHICIMILWQDSCTVDTSGHGWLKWCGSSCCWKSTHKAPITVDIPWQTKTKSYNTSSNTDSFNYSNCSKCSHAAQTQNGGGSQNNISKTSTKALKDTQNLKTDSKKLEDSQWRILDMSTLYRQTLVSSRHAC